MRDLLGLLILLLIGLANGAQAQTDPHLLPVAEIAPGRLDVTLPQGRGQIPIYLSQDWTDPLPGVTRAVVVVHGLLCNADAYFADAKRAQAASGQTADDTLLIVPQFLADEDIAGHGLPDSMLRWGREAWSGGEPAHGPIAASSFDALDAVLARLADQRLFPNLHNVVVAGHSAGGQVVQRYAVVVKAEGRLQERGIHLRYVVANPSSYLYFNDERPNADGRLVPFNGAAACPRFDQWKYGFNGALPPYVTGKSEILAAAYAKRDVIYLLGTADTNPNHPVLDKSCAAEAQGPYRFARGHAYFNAMQKLEGDSLQQRLLEVPGVGHEGGKMLESACGLAALFDKLGC